MADLTITDVGIGSNTRFEAGVFGESANPGDVVYFNSATTKWLKAQADGTATEAGASRIGVCMTPVEADDEHGIVATEGTVRIVADVAFAEGTTYVVSATAGAIAPDADITTSTHYKTILGVGGTEASGTATLDVLDLKPQYTGHQIP